LGKIEAIFRQKRLDLGKIEILYPQKHLVSYGYELYSLLGTTTSILRIVLMYE